MPFDPDKYLGSKESGFSPDDYLKKKGTSETDLEVGSEVGGLSQTPDQPLSSGYQRILKAGKIPENPFEKAALKQPAIDEVKALPYTGEKPKEQQPLKQPSIYDLAVTDTENWYGAAPSPRKKIASFNEEAEVIKSRYEQLINSLGDPNNIDKLYDKEVSDLNKKYGLKLENGEYKFPDIEAKTDEEYNKQVPVYNEKIKKYNEEVGNINSKYKKTISDYNASIGRIGNYDKEIQDLANKHGLFIENGEVKVSQGEIDKYQEVYSRKLDERLSRISDAKKNPYIKDVITKLGSGSAGVLNMPYNAMALSEKAGNALLGLIGAEPSTYWQDFATYLNENKNELSQNANRYEQDVLTMVGDGDMGGAIGKVGLDIAESLPMLATLIMGNAYGAAIGKTTQVGVTNTQAAINARNVNKANLAFMGGGKSAEEYMSMNNRTDLSEFAKIVEALGVGVSEILFEQEGTIKILNGIRKGIQDRGENIVRNELKQMLQTNMQRNMSLLMRGNSDMIRESVSEGMTQLTDNIIKKALVDPSIDIWEGVTDSMISGGLIGKGINLSLNAANHVQTKGARNAVKEAIKQVPQNYSLDAKEKIATLTLEKQAIQERNKDAAKPIQDLVAPQVQAIDEEIKKIAAKEEGIELPVEEKPKEGEKKKPEVKIPKSEVKVSPEGITSLKEEKTTEEPKGKITLTEKAPMSEEEKGSLMLKGENLFTRQINKDGEKFGSITVEEQGDKWKVKDVYVDKEKQGYGKEVYRQMNDMAQAEGKTIVSEVPKKNQSQKATYMWESLVNSGEAIKNEDGSYKMLPPKEVIDFVNRIRAGEKMNSPEDLQFYENNKKSIESQLKTTEEPSNAKRVSETTGQVQEGGNVRPEGEGNGSQNIQQPEEAGAKASDEKGRLVTDEMHLIVSADTKSALEAGEKKRVIEFDESGNPVVKEVDFDKGDADVELERLGILAERGKLTIQEFQNSYFGQVIPTNTFGEVKKIIATNPVEFINKLKGSFLESETTVPQPKEASGQQEFEQLPQDKKEAAKKKTSVSDEVKSIIEKQKKDETKTAGIFLFGDVADLFRGKRQKRAAKSIVQFVKEQFSRTKGVPQSAFNEYMKAMGAIRARRYDITNSLDKVINDAKRIFGKKFTDKDYDDIQKAFESMGTSKQSKDIAFNIISSKLPKESKVFIEEMRTMVDNYTEELKSLDLIGIKLETTFDKNKGYYVTRTYKKHTDRNWTWDNIPDKIKEDAADVFIELFPEKNADEVLGMMKEMIESNDLTSVVIRQGQSLADIDKSQLNKRSEFLTDHPEIRRFLGENRDPFYNYAVSLTKMAEMIERGKMIQNIIDIGIKEGWLSDTPSLEKNHTSSIKYNDGIFYGKPGTKKLSEYYTTSEISDAISSFFSYEKITNPWMRAYMSAVTNVKIAKTAASIKGTIRNFKSNFTNWIANGNWNVIATVKELKDRIKDKESKTEFVRELYEKNIIGDSSNAGELLKNVQDLSDKLTSIMSNDESFSEKAYRKIRGAALDLYSLADDVWKAARYISEYTRYRDVYMKKGYTEEKANQDAKSKAMDIMHKTSTYYSQLPKIIQNMRKLPFTNTFVSFPYLTTVNYLGTWDTALKELKDSDTALIGVQRIAGSLMGVSVLALSAALINKGNDQDEEKIEAWRKFLPDYWQNDIITIQKDNKNGTAEYGNTSYLDYYNAITTPVLILQRRLLANGEITTDDVKDAAIEFAGKFIGWDILFNKITNLKNNDDNGKMIYNEEEDFRSKFEAMTIYLLESLEPGTLTDARRIFNSYRQGYNWQGQLVGVATGSQVRTIDPIKSMNYYILPKYKESFNNARRIYTDELRKYNKLVKKSNGDKENLNEAKTKSERILNQIIENVIDDYNAAIKVGCKEQDIKDAIKNTRFDADIRDAIYNGGMVFLTDDGGVEYNIKKTESQEISEDVVEELEQVELEQVEIPQ